MDPRTTTIGRRRRALRRPPVRRRPALLLGVAAAGALTVSVLTGTGPAAQAEAGTAETASSRSVDVAEELGLPGEAAPPAEAVPAPDLEALEQLTASRSTRQADRSAAQQAQAAADQAELDRRAAEEAARAAEAEAAAQAEEAAAQAAAQAQEAEAQQSGEQEAQAPAASTPAPAAAPPPAASGTAAPAGAARVTNTAGVIKPVAQAAADAVVTHVPGAAGITIGGTRASAADPGGHPSGLALDYMCTPALGDAIVAYHRAHWDELGVDYLIWQQRMLSSPDGAWKPMADRGSATANHLDHVHVNYVG
ncbi:hypothetical protein [Geodermatophilus marinus]|uniref:hypothetical protein n=1 Tax=Geodermatophilus sp. LHW52908 TaxID=2303986 RepID=UPI000E3EA30C|nr:hypothetical protein [Geodermatophilus sp. LHW52908]RFU21629.1 hypothetical protein D0Z06_10560 [Geodermatophilus sp. LHW52908]